MYKVILLKQALKDFEKIKQNKALKENAKKIVDVISENPYQTPPSYEKLQGDLLGFYSRRINRQHRLVYKVDEIKKEIIIVRMWTHYE